MTDDALFDLIAALEIPLSVGDVRFRTAAKLEVRRITEETETDTPAAAFNISAAQKREPK